MIIVVKYVPFDSSVWINHHFVFKFRFQRTEYSVRKRWYGVPFILVYSNILHHELSVHFIKYRRYLLYPSIDNSQERRTTTHGGDSFSIRVLYVYLEFPRTTILYEGDEGLEVVERAESLDVIKREREFRIWLLSVFFGQGCQKE